MFENEVRKYLNKEVEVAYREDQKRVIKRGVLKCDNKSRPTFMLIRKKSGIVEGIFEAYSVFEIKEVNNG